jgi:hypothetical protein
MSEEKTNLELEDLSVPDLLQLGQSLAEQAASVEQARAVVRGELVHRLAQGKPRQDFGPHEIKQVGVA